MRKSVKADGSQWALFARQRKQIVHNSVKTLAEVRAPPDFRIPMVVKNDARLRRGFGSETHIEEAQNQIRMKRDRNWHENPEEPGKLGRVLNRVQAPELREEGLRQPIRGRQKPQDFCEIRQELPVQARDGQDLQMRDIAEILGNIITKLTLLDQSLNRFIAPERRSIQEFEDSPCSICWGKTWSVLFFLIFGFSSAMVDKTTFMIEAQDLPKYGVHDFQKP
jgi:hypothetical protein